MYIPINFFPPPFFSEDIILVPILFCCSNKCCFHALFFCVILLSRCSPSLVKAIAAVVCDRAEQGSAARWWFVKLLTLQTGAYLLRRCERGTGHIRFRTFLPFLLSSRHPLLSAFLPSPQPAALLATMGAARSWVSKSLWLSRISWCLPNKSSLLFRLSFDSVPSPGIALLSMSLQ